MPDNGLICERQGVAGTVALDRPKALNALTPAMVRDFAAALDLWEQDDAVTRVVISSRAPRAFCAGGDIRLMYELGRRGEHSEQVQFWRDEYVLNRRLKRYRKPVVALIDGIVMGGGAGISMHGAYRVAGDGFLFAMPEAGIGFFPDVGASYFLPRLPGRTGTFLALTGARIGAGDGLACGLATAYCPSGRFAELAEALREPGDVAATIAAFSGAPPTARQFAASSWIDECFGAPTLVAILARLDAAAASSGPAREAAAALRAHSPTSLAIALRQMREGEKLDMEGAMRMEFRVVSRICRGHDFYEGIRAALIDRDRRPAWRPAAVADVREADVEAYFESLEAFELAF